MTGSCMFVIHDGLRFAAHVARVARVRSASFATPPEPFVYSVGEDRQTCRAAE